MHPADEHIKRLKAFSESEEGKKWIKDYFGKLQDEEDRQNRYIDKIHSLYGDNIDVLLEKLMDKYYSDEYIQRELKMGYYEPREPLLWLMFEYARKYCEECENKTYYNTFTAGAYYLGSYVIQIMCGQGSVLKIDKRKGKKYGN